MAEDGTQSTPVKEALKQWITLDDELRALQKRCKDIRTEKQALGDVVLTFMRENDVDDFKLEGSSAGTITRSVRSVKPGIKRNTIRTQLLLHFSDQPQKVSEALRAIEGIPEGEDAASVAVQKELLTRRIKK
jgi:Arc/MetJ family transcription regulator